MMEIKKYIRKNNSADSQFASTILNWLYHVMNDIETEPQMKDSLKKLDAFVDSSYTKEINKDLIVNTRIFIRESFKPMLRLLCQCYFNDVFCGDVNENCWVESDNAALKKDPLRPHANSSLPVATKNVLQHGDRRMNSLRSKAVQKATSQILPKTADTEVDAIRHTLSKDIVEHKREKGIQQYISSSGKCCVYAISLQFDSTFTHCHSDYSYRIAEKKEDEMVCHVRKSIIAPLSVEERGPIPSYHRTREVRIKESTLSCGSICVVIDCDCNYYKRLKVTCRHVYRIIGESPAAKHFGLENFLAYEVHYGDNLDYTKHVDAFNAEVENHGGGMLLRTSLSDLTAQLKKCGCESLEWYNETRNDVGVDVNPLQQHQKEDEIASTAPMIGEVREQSNDRAQRKIDNGSRNEVMTIEMMQNPKKQSCYTRVMPTFVDTTKLCKSEEDIQGLNDLLTQYQAKMRCKNVSKDEVENVSGAMLSFPSLEKNKKEARLKPIYSPSKRK